MSGRAGRRGIDDRGIVILCVDEKMEPSVAKGMLKGHADPLNSSFHLGYNMLLNLLRFEGVDPEFLIRRSFHQFQHDQHLPVLQAKLAFLEGQLAGMVIADADAVEEYYLIRSQLESLRGVMHKVMMEPIHMLPFMQPGRLIKVSGHWGVVVNFQKKPTSALPPSADNGAEDRPSQAYV
jgi:ATP-dependent RNA helicase DOB1